MMEWLVVLSFVAGAALSWGVYVPVVHRAAFELKSNLRSSCWSCSLFRYRAMLPPWTQLMNAIMQPGDLGPFSSGAQLRLGIDLQGA